LKFRRRFTAYAVPFLLLNGNQILDLVELSLLNSLYLHDVFGFLVRTAFNDGLCFDRSNAWKGVQFLFTGCINVDLLAGRQLCGRGGRFGRFFCLRSLAGFVSETGLAGATAGAAFAGASFAGAAEPTVTKGFMASTCLAERPAFERSSTDLYGRPANDLLGCCRPNALNGFKFFLRS